ncbi:MAG TPA: acyl-CoA dehydrogenase [Planctomycetes bacterium]|nr:acyl-CoA dehydrogenase [Fuerstiella sp.]HIK90612.1 acyl-CoA dehydrogenase [Planctomycetota bacterium]
MNFLKQERAVLNELLPGLDEKLAKLSLTETEQPGNPGIAQYRESGGVRLLIPTAQGGLGANALQAVRVSRAIGSRSPSLAIATTMHQFSVVSLVEAAAVGTGVESLLLETVASRNHYVASGFAEGKTGQNILTSSMQVQRSSDGLIVNGSKKPCSLSESMDLLTVSLSVPPGKDGEPSGFAVAIVPADAEGVELRPFWSNSVLAGAESDEVILRDVAVPDAFVAYLADEAQAQTVQTRGFIWFELLISAAYLGVASALVERVLVGGRGTPTERTQLAIDVEAAMGVLENAARAMMDGENNEDALAHVIMARYAVQGAIERVTFHAAELLGGMAFLTSNDVVCLLASARALAFHPPSRASLVTELDDYLGGKPFAIA